MTLHLFLLRIHCSVYIMNSFLAACCMCRWVSGLFNCKSRLIKFFHHFMWLKITGGLHFLFLYFIERHRWRSVLPWLNFVDQTLHRHSIFFPIMCTSVTGGMMINRRQLWWCKHHLMPGLPFTGKRTGTRTSQMQQSREAYIIFKHDFVRLAIKVDKQSSEFGRHIIDYRKKQTRTLRISENKFYKRWRHDTRHKGPPVKIAPGPLPFNPALVGINCFENG